MPTHQVIEVVGHVEKYSSNKLFQWAVPYGTPGMAALLLRSGRPPDAIEQLAHVGAQATAQSNAEMLAWTLAWPTSDPRPRPRHRWRRTCLACLVGNNPAWRDLKFGGHQSTMLEQAVKLRQRDLERSLLAGAEADQEILAAAEARARLKWHANMAKFLKERLKPIPMGKEPGQVECPSTT